MTKYQLVKRKPSNILRHGGPRDHRNVALYVNGKLFEEWQEDSQDFNYSSGKYFDKKCYQFVKHLQTYWPGELKIIERKQLETFPDEWED